VDGIAVLRGQEYGPNLRDDVFSSIIRRIGMVQPTHFGYVFSFFVALKSSKLCESSYC